jgi:hypothetical protein
MKNLSIRRAGQPVLGFAVGDTPAPADPYAAAAVQLSELMSQVYAAKNLIENHQFQQAVAMLQGIGSQAASVLGPQIDAGPYPRVTQSWTQDASVVNSSLAAIAGTDAAAAQQASSAVDRMMADYSTAIDQAHQAMGIAPRTMPPAAWPYVLFSVAVLATGGTALYLTLRH